MKFSVHLRFIFATSLMLATMFVAAANKPAKPPVKSNFQRTKNHIDALLGPRLKAEPLPDVLPNPFQLTEAPSSTANPEQKIPDRIPISSDDEMLLYHSASLKITGVVRINDQTHLVINQAPYKVGDSISVKTKDGTLKLRVLGIAPGELTLGLNDAVQIVKFKK